MANGEHQLNVEGLLADLRSADTGRRLAAAEAMAEQPVRNAEIVAALQTIARGDHFAVRAAAERALSAIGSLPVEESAAAPAPDATPAESSPPEPAAAAAPPPAPTARKLVWAGARLGEFLIGFFGQVGVWIVAGVVYTSIGPYGEADTFKLFLVQWLPLIFLTLNAVAWVVFMFRRTAIGLGMLAAYGAAFILVLLFGLLLLVTCGSVSLRGL